MRDTKQFFDAVRSAIELIPEEVLEYGFLAACENFMDMYWQIKGDELHIFHDEKLLIVFDIDRSDTGDDLTITF